MLFIFSRRKGMATVNQLSKKNAFIFLKKITENKGKYRKKKWGKKTKLGSMK